MFLVSNRDDLIKACLDHMSKGNFLGFSKVLKDNPYLKSSTKASYAGKTFLELLISRGFTIRGGEKRNIFFNALLDQSDTIKINDFAIIFEEFSLYQDESVQINGFFKIHKEKIIKSLSIDKDNNFILNNVLNFHLGSRNSLLGSASHICILNNIINIIKDHQGISDDGIADIFDKKMKLDIGQDEGKTFSVPSFLSKFTSPNNKSLFLEFSIDRHLKLRDTGNCIIENELNIVYDRVVEKKIRKIDILAFNERMNKFYKYLIKNKVKTNLDKSIEKITITDFKFKDDYLIHTDATKKWLLTYPEIMLIDDEISKNDLINIKYGESDSYINKASRIEFLLSNICTLNISDEHLFSTIKYLHDAKGIAVDVCMDMPDFLLKKSLDEIVENTSLFEYIFKSTSDNDNFKYKLLTHVIKNGLSDEFSFLLKNVDIETLFFEHNQNSAYKDVNSYIKESIENSSYCPVLEGGSLLDTTEEFNGIEKIMLTKSIYDSSVNEKDNISSSKRASFKI